MTTTLTIGAAALLAGAGFAQQSLQPVPITAPVKDAGVFHVATGTWTRGASSHANFGPKVLYNNNAPSGYYGNMTAHHDWVDDGNIPSISHGVGATADSYLVDGFQTAYCTAEGPAGTALHLAFYNPYGACTNYQVLTPVLDGLATAPGSSAAGTLACWIVTFDVAGTSLEFTIGGDADGTYDGLNSIDNIGLLFGMNPTVTATASGPILCGDPNNYPMGDGTYYQNPSSSLGTGLDTADQFWIFDYNGVTASGCYWFGGYAATGIYSAFWWQLYGDGAGGPTTCPSFCSSGPNSTGGAAQISVTNGCGTTSLSVSATPVPNQPGIFFTGTSTPGGGAGIPFGNGLLCTAGTIVRKGVVVGSGNVASQTFGINPAAELHVQFWYRDPAAGGAFYDTSDARDTN